MYMKKILFISLSIMIFSSAKAQIYEMDQVNGQTINTCSGIFYDSGGSGGFYQNSENYTVTFCPSTANTSINLDFTLFQLGTGDQLCVFDGINTSATSFGCFSNTVPASSAQASSTNTTGCLTLTFSSDNSSINQGWQANVSCVLPCQTVLSELASAIPSPVPLVDGYIDICPGETVQFFGQGSYPQNNTYYWQSDATSTFEWTVEGQTYPGQNFNYTFNNPGGYKVQLTITDSLGCKNTNFLNQRVRAAADATFDGTLSSLNTICLGDTITLMGEVTPPIQTFAPPLSRGDSIFLPDGVGVCYQTTLAFNDFNPGQLITNVNDIINICVTMEHSYMGDLNIQIECPNGNTTTLHQYSGGGGVFLGEPIDIDTDLSPGLGYQYCWAPGATQTWTQAVNNGNTITVGGNQTLAPGTYATSSPLSSLIGCPLNGIWEIEICDNLAIDNGYVFNWGIQFDPSIYPSLDAFAAAPVSQSWNTDPATILVNQGDTVQTVVPASPGNASYTFSMTNEFGCSYDTTINITVLPFTDGACFDCDTLQLPTLVDTTICLGDSASFDATTTTSFDNLTYSHTGTTAVPTGSFLDISIPVSGVGGNIVSANTIVSVCVDITHLAPDDIDMFLIAPNGTQLELSTDNNGGGSNFTNTCFTPTATTNITAGSAPFTGDFQPEGSWNNLYGSLINGNWTFRIQDDSPGFSGTLNSLHITFSNPYSLAYTWTPTDGLSCSNCPDPNAGPDTTTTYIVTALDNLGCSETDTVTVFVVQPPDMPIASCGTATAVTATINWTAIANTVGYEVNIDGTGWIPANNTLSHNVTGLSPSQTIQVEVRSIGTGICVLRSAIDTIQCTTLACDLTINLDSVQNVSCFGGSNGIAYVSAATSAPVYTFSLNGTNYPNGNINGLSIGTYTVKVVDSFGCEDSVTTTITQPTDITLATDSTPVSCFNGNDGIATVVANGGVGNYTYQWNTSPVQTTATATGLTDGSYLVTVTDGNNCTEIAQVVVTEPTILTMTLDKTDALCFENNDGQAWATVGGGVGNYSYQWNTTPIQTTDTAFNLVEGTYTITATDGNGCIIIDSITIGEPNLLVVTLDSIDVTCFGAMDGSIAATVTGGTVPYTYLWNTIPSQDSTTAINLSGGTYTVTVTDANGCTATNTIVVNEPTEILANFVSNQVTCFGLSDGDATVVPYGGVGNYTYQWQTTPVQTTAHAINLPGGDVSVLITDGDGCSNMQTVNIFAPVLVFIDTMYSTPATCYETPDGSVGTSASGGTGNISYDWNDGSTGNLQFNLLGGMYSVTITDLVGCQAIDSILVFRPDSLDINFSPTSLLCNGDGSGAVSTTITGGTFPYAYAWNTSPSQIIPSISNLDAGFYDLTITDANNCQRAETIEITEPDALAVTLGFGAVTCAGDGDGSAFVTTTGGVGTYSYQWDNVPTLNTDTIFNINGGNHIVIVTDTNNCQITDTIDVFEPLPLTATGTSIQISCAGNTDGSATIVAIEGNGGYTYQWNTTPVQTTVTITNLSSGFYPYTVTDIKNCTYSDSIEVIEPQPLASTIIGTNINCNNVDDGTATVTPQGGTAPFTYTWNTTTQTDSFVTGLDTGWHFVTIVDSFGCSITNNIHLTEPSPLSTILTNTSVSCNSGSDGTATATVSGGTSASGNYTYLWSNGDVNATATGLSAGWAYVTITDDNNCILIDSTQLSEPTPLSSSFTMTEVNCFGGNDGTATVTASGGVGNYTYQWNTIPIQTTATATNLSAGFHIVTVTDGNNCPMIDSVEVTEALNPISLTFSTSVPSCNGGSDGVATVIATGGTPGLNGYVYLWDNNQPSPIASGITAGTYTVTVTDSRGCSTFSSVTVLEPSPIISVVSQQSASCFGGNDGTATIAASGGTPNSLGQYTYTWNTSPVQVGATASNLSGGETYFVTITDENSCVSIDSIEVGQPTPLELAPSSTDISCFGFADGEGSVLPNGSIPPYTYQWDANANSQTTNTANQLDLGSYSVTVTDFNGCQNDTFITIAEPSKLVLQTLQEDVICKNASTGSITALIAGGTPWYSYQWTVSGTGSTIDELSAGDYTVTVTDGNGCEISKTMTITEPDQGVEADYGIEAVSCYGERDGRLSIIPDGGQSPYEYSRDGVNYNDAFTWVGLSANDYEVYIRDALGCIYKDTITVTQPDELIVDLGEDILIIVGEKRPLIPIIENGTIPYFYNWTPNDSVMSCYTCPIPVVERLQADQRYFLTVTDANGCVGSDDIFVRVQKNREVYVATGFSPNGDNTNDYLYVQGGEGTAKVVRFEVFDRWGERVFLAEDTPVNQAEFGWNGRFKNKILNPAVFGWRLVVEYTDGEEQVYKGNTTLIR